MAGRHSSHSQFAFYRSVVGWALPWLLIAAVVVTGMWFAVDALGGDATSPKPKVEGGAAGASPSPEKAEESPTAKPSPSPKKTKASPDPFEDEATDVELITEGITIQILNGTSSELAGTDMSDELTGLGFNVVVVNQASKPYAETTVFWSTDASQEAAEALAARFDWVAQPKPDNLTDSVSIHVVVGEDYL